MKSRKVEHSDWAKPIQPLIEITSIGCRANQRLTELQSNFITYFIDANLRQFKALIESKDVKSAIDKQIDFFHEIDTKWKGMTEEEIETAKNAQQSISLIMENNIQNIDLIPKGKTESRSH
tara:strand:- start:630 stop:992 length:363 start_codon:yes stop_codon:yes gene_type:complete